MNRGVRITTVFILILMAAFGVFATTKPLLNIVGYELGAVTALLMAVFGGLLGTVSGRASMNQHGAISKKVRRGCFYACAAGLAAILLPLIIASFSAHFIQKCNIGTGLPLFLWLSIPTMFNYTAAGFAAGRWFKSRAAAAAFLILYFLATSVFTFALYMMGSRWTIPNMTIGLFSTTGFYGFELSIPLCFYGSRILTLLMSAFFIGLAMLKPDPGTRPGSGNSSAGAALAAAAALIFIFCLTVLPDQTGLGTGRRTLNRVLSQKFESANAVLHFEPGAMSEQQIENAARYTEWYIHEIREAVPMQPDWKIQAYLYTDDEQMDRLIGASDFYFSAPWLHEVHIEIRSIENKIYKHELTHAAMAAYGTGIFGTPYNIGVVEGIAVAVEDDFFRDGDFQEEFAAALKAKVLAPGGQTMNMLGFGSTDTWKSYQMAGGFTGFLINRYGAEKYSEFYAEPDAAAVYGKDMAALNSEWEEWLGKIDVSNHELRKAELRYNDEEFPAFYNTRCPRVGNRPDPNNPYQKIRLLKSESRNVELADLCTSFYEKDSNPEWLVNRADALLEAGDPEKAFDAIEKAVSAERIKNETFDRALALRAAILIARGDLVEAILTLDRRAEFGLADPEYVEFLIRIVQRESVRDILVDPFFRNKGDRIKALEAAIKEDSRFGEAQGRLALMLSHYKAESPEAFLARIKPLIETFISRSSGLPGMKTAALVRLGDAYLRVGRYADAESAYRQSAGYAAPGKEVFTVERRLQRAEFFRKTSF
ncbi:MAG TPA: hypothetical protein PLN69_04455 [bacterium]|nr:hypothetical protein [bacterium]